MTKKLIASLPNDIKTRDIYGIHLIDGNHVFLHCLKKNEERIKSLTSKLENFSFEDEKKRRDEILKTKSNTVKEKFYKDWSSDKKIKEMPEWLKSEISKLTKFHPEDLIPHFAMYANHYNDSFQDIFLRNIGFNFEQLLHNKHHLESAIKFSYLKSNKVIFSTKKIENFIFDADLPDKDRILNWLYKDLVQAEKWHQIGKEGLIQKCIERIERNMWGFNYENSDIEAPYNTKTRFLDFLENKYAIADKNKTQIIRGRKVVNVKSNYISEQEKEVDARLVISGCEAANNSKVDFICLITNDGDYVPLVEHLKKNNKEVFLLSLVVQSQVSKPLMRSVGQDNCFNINNISLLEQNNIELKYSNFRFHMGQTEDEEKWYKENKDYFESLQQEHEDWINYMEKKEKKRRD